MEKRNININTNESRSLSRSEARQWPNLDSSLKALRRHHNFDTYRANPAFIEQWWRVHTHRSHIPREIQLRHFNRQIHGYGVWLLSWVRTDHPVEDRIIARAQRLVDEAHNLNNVALKKNSISTNINRDDVIYQLGEVTFELHQWRYHIESGGPQQQEIHLYTTLLPTTHDTSLEEAE